MTEQSKPFATFVRASVGHHTAYCGFAHGKFAAVKVNVTSARCARSVGVCYLCCRSCVFKSCSVPLLESDLLLRVAKSMFISSVNHSTFLEALPAGLVATGLQGNFTPTPPLYPSLSLSLIPTPSNCLECTCLAVQ